MNGRLHAIARVGFKCAATIQGVHHVLRLIEQTLPPSERRTSQPYPGYGNRIRFLCFPHQCLSTILLTRLLIKQWSHY